MEQKTTPKKTAPNLRKSTQTTQFQQLRNPKISCFNLSPKPEKRARKHHLTRNHTGTCQQHLFPNSSHECAGTVLRLPKTRRRNRAVILILLPVTILLWLIGWILFYAGSQTRHVKPEPKAQTDTITTGILLEEPQEYATPHKTR